MSRAPALWTRNRGLARSIAHQYFIPGADRDDVQQEALIGLWEAARLWDKERGASFATFASLVIHRRLHTCLKAANRRKHRFLTDASRDLDLGTVEEPGGQLALILEALPSLSELERQSLADSLNGVPIRSKRYDNALQRARRKLRKVA